MADLLCCRFADLVRRRAFQAEEHDAFTCGRKPLREASGCSLPKSYRIVHNSHLERPHGYGASFLRLASPAHASTCCYSLTPVVGKEEEAIAHVGAHPKGDLLHHIGLRTSNVEMHNTEFGISSDTKNSRDVASSMPSTDIQAVDGTPHLRKPPAHVVVSHGSDSSGDGTHVTSSMPPTGIQVIDDTLHLRKLPTHVTASHGSDGSIDGTHISGSMRGSIKNDALVDKMHNTNHDVPSAQRDTFRDDLASSQNGGQEVLSDSPRDSRNSSSASSFGLVSALEIANMSGDILSSVAPFRVSDFNLIVRSLKPPAKIIELFHWMKANCTTLDVHTMVFRELGKRREWTILDDLLNEEVKICSGKTLCEVFNKVFSVCVTEGAPTWASKWFRFMLQVGVEPDLATFRLLVPLFKRYEMPEDATFAYTHMHNVGVECPIASSAILTLYLCACQFEKAKQIYNRTWDANQEPWSNLLTLQLNAFVRDEKLKEAEAIMSCMLESGESIDISDYNLMITVNGKAGEYIRAREWFFRIEKDGLQPNEATYRSIIGACGRAGNLYDALSFYDKMVSLCFSPSHVNYNTLIHLHRKVDNHGRILTILSDMKSAQCCPNSYTLNSVLKVYERYGRLEKLPEALNLLKEAGWMPSTICHGFLIRAYIRCNMVKQAMEIFEKLCCVAELDEIMCHNLVCMCKSVGCYDEAISVYQEMCRLGKSKPCLRTSCAVIDAYSLKGAIEEGEALYKELRSDRNLDAATYNVVLSMYLKAGSLEKAARVLKEVLQEELLQPDLYLFLCMLKVCAKCGLQEEAVEIYRRVVKSKIPWTESLYTGVLHSCGRALPTEDISVLLNSMVSVQIPINNVTCNLLMDIFGKAGLLDKAEYVLRLAQKQGVQDGITFSTIIDAYGKNKRFEEMESVFMEMLNEGFKVCVEAYNAMLDAYGNAGQIRKMENTLERMRIVACIPNITTFNTLIKVYGQEGLFRDLQIVLKRVEAAGLKLDSYSFTTLIHAYGAHADMLDESLRWFQEMQKAGFEPDFITYSCLISVLQNAGYRREAARLSSWIKTEGIC